MERHEVLEMVATLKLAGMRAACDEVVAEGIRRRHPIPRVIGEPLCAQLADDRARSTAYRMGRARFPLAKTLAGFDFTASPVNEAPVRDLHGGGFLATQRNAVLVGGTGTGKSHLAIAIAASCVRTGARARFFNTVALVNPARGRGPPRPGRQARRRARPRRPGGPRRARLPAVPAGRRADAVPPPWPSSTSAPR